MVDETTRPSSIQIRTQAIRHATQRSRLDRARLCERDAPRSRVSQRGARLLRDIQHILARRSASSDHALAQVHVRDHGDRGR